MVKKNDRKKPVNAKSVPVINASFGEILPDGMGRCFFPIASRFLSRKSDAYKEAIQPIRGIKKDKIIILNGGVPLYARQAPTRLTRPHHTNVYGLHVSR